MNAIVVHFSKFKVVLIMVGALMFVCIGLTFALWRKEMELSLWVIVICSWIGIPFFGFGFLYACYRLIVPKPAVIVNHEGIFDNASAVSAGLVGWGEIADIAAYDFCGQCFLGIVPLDIEGFLLRQPAFKRWMMRANLGLGLPPVNIPQSMITMNVDELMFRIQEYHRKYIGYEGEHENC